MTLGETDSARTPPIPMVPAGVGGYAHTSWGNLMAASILMAVPTIVAFLIIQWRIVSGLTEGAVK